MVNAKVERKINFRMPFQLTTILKYHEISLMFKCRLLLKFATSF